MNIVFALILIASIILTLFKDPNAMLSGMLEGVTSAISMAIGLVAVYSVWLGLLKVMEKLKLDKAIGRALKPFTKRLFKGESEETHELIALNMSANLLGMGGAATPLGIKATEKLAGENKKAGDNLALFIVINCTSIQLIPTTIIGLRAAEGSVNPGDIILPSLLATAISTVTGIILCVLYRKIRNIIRLKSANNIIASDSKKE